MTKEKLWDEVFRYAEKISRCDSCPYEDECQHGENNGGITCAEYLMKKAKEDL